jgi:hypothetical protein
MPIRVQTIRSSVKNTRPAAGSREPGELYTNYPDKQLGVIDASKAAMDLLALRFFSATTDYVAGDFVWNAGKLYRAKATIVAGAFNVANWDQVPLSSDYEPPIALGLSTQYWRGDKSWQVLDKAAVGLSNVNNTSDANKPVSTAQQAAIDGKVSKAGDSMSGPLVMPANGSASAASITFGTTGTGLYGGSSQLNFTVQSAQKLLIGGSALVTTVPVTLPADPTNALDAATKQYADTKLSDAPSDGTQYARKNAAWAAVSVPAVTSVSDNAPSSPQPFQLWWESDTGNLYIWYTDADTSQWVQINLSGGAGALTAESRNRIVNGAMQISQELGDTATGTTGAYLCDQWLFQYAGPTISAAHVSTVVTPGGALTSLNFNIATAKPSLAAGDYFQINQPIEGTRLVDFGWGTAAARQAVLRFTVMCGVAGTYAASIRNAAGNRTWVGAFTIAAGEINTYVTRTLVIPGDTTGTWPKTSAVGAYLAICFASGTTYIGVAGWQAGFFLGVAGMANAASITGPHIQLADVGLYLDRNNTGLAPPWQMPDEAQELAACMRYYQQLSNTIVNSATSAYALMLRATMRSNPAVTGGGTGFTLGNVTPYSISIFQTAQAYQNLVANARL